MIVLVPGFVVFAVLFLLGRNLGNAAIIGLLASLPFGSTAFVQLTSLGGSTPLIFTLFVIVLVLTVLWQYGIQGVLFTVLQRHWEGWVVLAIMAYAIAGASLLPSFFAGQTSAFIPILGIVTEVPLAPSGSNITQTSYFTLSALAFFGVAAVLHRARDLRVLRLAFLTCCTVHVALGLIDVLGKAGGVGDLLDPIRTASYANLVEVQEGGFWRIVGGYPEASAYAMGTLYCLAFSLTLWRFTGSPLALALSLALTGLLILSTSTTAYVGGAVAGLPLAIALVVGALRGRITARDLVLCGAILAAGIGIIAIFLVNERAFDPFVDLVNRMVLEKSSSSSGKERGYWNAKSLQAFVDSYGIGIGMGSSRSSSWIISVVAQLGLAGTSLIAVLVGVVASGLRQATLTGLDRLDRATIASISACALTHLVALSISAGSADPGILVFVALAAVVHGKRLTQRTRRLPMMAGARQARPGGLEPVAA